MTATMRVIRADGAVETDAPMLFEQKEKKLVLDVFDVYFFAPTPWARVPSTLTDEMIKLARKISTDIGEPDRYTRPPFQLTTEFTMPPGDMGVVAPQEETAVVNEIPGEFHPDAPRTELNDAGEPMDGATIARGRRPDDEFNPDAARVELLETRADAD